MIRLLFIVLLIGCHVFSAAQTSYTIEDVNNFRQSAIIEEEKRDWEMAINYTYKQLDASNFIFGEHSIPSSMAMYNLTMDYLRMKEYDKVIEWGKKIKEVLEALPQDSLSLDILARSYGNVSSAYHMKGQHEIASHFMELSLAIRRENDGVGALNYEEYLSSVARIYYYEGNYPKALLYGKEVTNIYEKKYKDNSIKYGCAYLLSLGNLCELYLKMSQYEDAIITGQLSLNLIKDGICEDSTWLIIGIYNNLAAALSSIGSVNKAIDYLDKVLNIPISGEYKKNSRILLANILLNAKQDTIRAISELELVLRDFEDNNYINRYPRDYVDVLHGLFKAYRNVNNSVGLKYLKKAINKQREVYGDESIAYANLLLEYVIDTFVETLINKSSTDELYSFLNQASKIVKRHINNSIYNMSKTERSIYWNRYKGIFTWLIPTISGLLQSDEWNSMAYDAALFYKGMLLSAEIELKSVVFSSNDSALIELYNEYVGNLSRLEKLYSVNCTTTDIDSLKSIIRNNEYLLSLNLSRFNKQYKGTDFSWKDVKDHLRDNDVAIEIMSYESLDGVKTYYDAYIINNKSKSPKLIPLFAEKDLKKYVLSDSIDYNGLSKIMWKKQGLCEAIHGAKNIYFSPSGLLNTIGIEYSPFSEDSITSEKYEFYRLSSTRELCTNNGITISNACLYGGLDYNDFYEITTNTSDNKSLSRNVRETLISRGGFEPLIGSIEEIEQVESELVKKSVNCIVYRGAKGTEESIKNLSGSQINLIHLSTHGMYIPDAEIGLKDTNNYRFIMSGETSYDDNEKQSLSRSFLVMSGGNMLTRRKEKQDGIDDGILTALEISHLDFSNLDLVVLSACQTALGDIDYDGVYGLQRGFKKAGANTIIMSLDKVDDEATKILMVEFYRNLMSGKSKYQSLKEAQMYLRKVDNGKYDDPKYWASFIMLDGLN